MKEKKFTLIEKELSKQSFGKNNNFILAQGEEMKKIEEHLAMPLMIICIFLLLIEMFDLKLGCLIAILLIGFVEITTRILWKEDKK